MKLMFVVPSFYDVRLPKKVKTGQAVIAGELCSSFSEKNEVLVTGYPVKGMDLGYAKLLPTEPAGLLRHMRARDVGEAIRVLTANGRRYGYRTGLKDGVKTLFYKALARKFVRHVTQNPCDVVAIHDFGWGNLEVLRKCIEKRLKCVVTLHMYVGRDIVLRGKAYLERIEREKYLFLETDVPITVVSSGMKRRILEDYRTVPAARITVIPNGTRLEENRVGMEEKVADERKKFLCIGTISERKNQMQLLHALKCLPEGIRARVKVLFIGVDQLDGRLQRAIAEGGYEDVAEYAGAVEHEEMASYFRTAFAVISASLNEAFGLTFIEGFAFGVPAVFFDDIDAVDELYSPEAVELIRGKREENIAQAITAMVNKTWDREKIREHADRFDIRSIAMVYEEVYRKLTV